MGVPIVLLGEGLVDTVIEVFVVGEDDMAADIVELEREQVRYGVCRERMKQRKRRTKPSGVVSVPARPPALSEESAISHEGPFWWAG